MRHRHPHRSRRPGLESLEPRVVLSEVVSFSLIDADADVVVPGFEAIPSNAQIDLATLPTRRLNVRANPGPHAVGSVRFALDANANFRTESSAPFALNGDSNGNYNPWTPTLGAHTLKATPYSGSNATGTVGAARTIAFTVVDSSTSQPSPSPTPTPTPTPPGQTPYDGTPHRVGVLIQAEDYDRGGAGVAYHDLTPLNDGRGYRTEGVDIQATTDAGAGFNVGWTRRGEWLEYTVDVPEAGTYTLELRVASSGTGGQLHVEFGGVDRTGAIAVPSTGGWQAWKTLSRQVSLNAGVQVVRLALDAEGPGGYVGNLNWFRLTPDSSDAPVDPPAPTDPPTTPGDVTVSGPKRVGQATTVDFAGPQSSETATPNPFLDYRLQVTFTGPVGQKLIVPGFFDGDGKGGGTGNVWRARFVPDQAGTWTYVASFRAGPRVAVDLAANAGTATGFDGTNGSISIAARDASAPGFSGKGILEYAGEHYLRFEDGTYFVKAGANSPENFLGYSGFDNTPTARHTYANHAKDWKTGDPDWNNGAGKAIIGALNYLADRGVNSIYFLPMNIGGDAKDTSPFVGPINYSGSTSNDNLRYDISKLDQWEKVLAHAQRKGIHLHVVLNEAEPNNKRELDNATLGTERKLYYRELAARFGHHNAITWNVSEEYDYQLVLTPETVKQFAGYLQAVDPYDHPITVHQYNYPEDAWVPFLGDSRFSSTSFQFGGSTAGTGAEVQKWRAKSAQAGRKIPISLDEIRSTSTTNMEAQRRDVLWPTLLSGGHIEWYVSGQDQTLDDFRAYQALWDYTGHARRFLEQHLPFWAMSPADNLLTGASGPGQVFAKAGEVYALHLPNGGGGTLDLSGASGNYSLRWFDPRTGLFAGTTRTVAGGGAVSLGQPPASTTSDWVVLLKRI